MPLLNVYESPLMGIWKINEPWQELFDSLSNQEVYLHDLHTIQSDKRKQEWLAVRLLLQHLSGKDASIRYHENGSPFLPDSMYHISISHTKGFAALLLTKKTKPGIDIEYHSERAWRLHEKYMNENEITFITSLLNDKNTKPVISRANIAAICWCAKETAYKALGESEVDFAEHLCIEPFSPSTEGVLIVKEKRTIQKLIFNINYRITEDFTLTWKE